MPWDPERANLRQGWLSSPAHQERANGEAGTDGRQQHQVTFLQASALHGVIQSERDRRRRGVPVLVDVDDDLLFRHTNLLRGGQDDALVRLVRHEQIEVFPREAVALQQPLADLAGVAHRELEYRLPILLDVVLAIVNRLMRRRQLAAGVASDG